MISISASRTAYSYHSPAQRRSRTRPTPTLTKTQHVKPSGVKVIINVGGRKFVTWKDTLRRFPNTLLGNEKLSSRFYDQSRGEYFIDRDPHLFRYILNYYRNGKLHRSIDDCNESFEEELIFYGIAPQEIHDCCFDEDQEEEQQQQEKLRQQAEEAAKPVHVPKTRFGKIRNFIWRTLEGEIESGIGNVIGMGFIYFVGLFIILSIFTTVYETVPCTDGIEACEERTHILDLLDIICIAVFSFEFVLRVLVCPDYNAFVRAPMNLIDFFSILPFYARLVLQSVVGSNLEAFVVLRVLRIFRVFKLSRHSKRLQRFGAAIGSCFQDLMSLTFVLLVAVLLFSSFIFFIERGAVEGMFTSIPDSMWYTIVTMITLG